jgi:hypothetical protein
MANVSTVEAGAGEPRPAPAPRRPRTVAIALLLVACFGALELVTRWKLFPMSADYSRFRTYPERAAQLVSRPGFRVGLIGNSATERGVDLAQLADALGREALAAGAAPGPVAPITIDEFVADASGINTWGWILERYFFSQGRAPDLLVINFFNNFLEDGGEPVEVGRLAQFFTVPRDWPEVMTTDLPDFDTRVEYILSSFWATFAARDRIKERVLRLIPGYKDYATEENAINFKRERRPPAAGRRAPSLKALTRLLEAARAHGARIAFVAFPMYVPGRPPYELDPEVVARLASYGQPLIDLRRVEALKPEHYEDDIHLNEKGRPLYTAKLAEALRSLVRARN